MTVSKKKIKKKIKSVFIPMNEMEKQKVYCKHLDPEYNSLNITAFDQNILSQKIKREYTDHLKIRSIECNISIKEIISTITLGQRAWIIQEHCDYLSSRIIKYYHHGLIVIESEYLDEYGLRILSRDGFDRRVITAYCGNIQQFLKPWNNEFLFTEN